MIKHLNKFILYSVLFVFSFFFIPLDTINKKINIINKRDFSERTSNTQFFDWSEVKELDPNYSFSTLVLNKNTEFIIYESAGYNLQYTKSGKGLPDFKGLGKNSKLTMLVTNCAINKDGEVLDVVIKIRNVDAYKSGGTVELGVLTGFEITKNQHKPSLGASILDMDVNDPITFRLFAESASCNFSLTYYKTGTYNFNTDNGVLGEITHVNGYFDDIDVVHYSYSNKFMQGNEGLRPNVGSSKIYYNKFWTQARELGNKMNKLKYEDNGIHAHQGNGGITNPSGNWFGAAALLLTNNLSNSYFEFTYGGVHCGMQYFFGSPYPYGIYAPQKTASKPDALGGESFEYIVSQYIPNNYYGTFFSYHEVYENLYSNTRFSCVKIEDSIDENLIVEENIRIENEQKDDVSEYFEISVTNNNVKAIAKAEYLESYLFYNHTYNLIIPVTMKKGLYDIDFVANQAKTTSKIEDDPEKEDPSPEVDVKVRYSLTVNYYNEATGEKIEESDYDDQYFNGDPYTTNRDKVGEEWDLVDDPPNMNGVIHEDTVVNYYFIRFHTLPVTGGSGKKYIIIAGLVLLLISITIVLLKIKSLFA